MDIKEATKEHDKLEQFPYVRIVNFLDKRGYSYTVTDVLNGYQKKEHGCYVSHTMNDCLISLKAEIVELLSN